MIIFGEDVAIQGPLSLGTARRALSHSFKALMFRVSTKHSASAKRIFLLSCGKVCDVEDFLPKRREFHGQAGNLGRRFGDL